MCPRPQGQRGAGERAAALERGGRGEPPLPSVLREQARGAPPRRAQGEAHAGPRRGDVEGPRPAGTERRWVVRSLRHAEAAEAALRARVAKAPAPVAARNLRGRGRNHFAASKT